jgi:hypothetical protein
MVVAGKARFGQDFTQQGAEAALHPVADDGVADSLGNGDAHAHRIVLIRYRKQDKTGARHAQAPVCS